MFKVAILGCENSHADAFIDLVNNKKIVSDVEFVGIYSNDAAAAKKLHDKTGVYIAERYDEFVGKVDGIMITARHGDNHYKYAKPYIASGIPMFIDKPITVSEADAIEFMRELKANNVRFSGGSSCIYGDLVQEYKAALRNETYGKLLGGFVRAPLNMDNPYGGFFFYSQHLVQVMCEVFGYYPKSVQAFKNGKVYDVIVHYDGFNVTATFVDGNYLYGIGISCEKNYAASAYTVDGGYEKEFMAFHRLLCGEAQSLDHREFIAPVYILNAMYRSILSGAVETVDAIGEV